MIIICHRPLTPMIFMVAAVSTVESFQSRRSPSSSYRPSPKDINRRRGYGSTIPINHNNPPSTFDWCRSYGTEPQVPTLSINSLLEAGRLDDAVVELKNHGSEVQASTYHAVIEACCAGGPKNQQKNKKNDRIEQAAELLQLMDDKITVHAHEIIISGYARRGRWQDASQMLVVMENVLDSDDTAKYNKNIYQTVLVALANANQFKLMNTLLTGMRRRGVKPTVYTYNALLKICASKQVSRWKEALALLSQCQREPGVNPDLITYTTTMRACARGRQAGKAMELFGVVKDMDMKLDVYCYTTAMDACAKGKRWRRAMSLLDEMKEEGIAPNEVTYGVAVTACGNGGKWERALELLNQMRAQKLRINTITYNSAIAALSTAARTDLKAARTESKQKNTGDSSDTDVLWKKALDLIQCMEREGVRRDSFTFSSAISTCGAAGRWEEAVNLINAMKGDGIKPNKVAYTSAISACASSSKWEPAFDLFNSMKSDGLQPDIVAYNALLGAGMAAEKPVEVYDMWLEMIQPSDEKVLPDIVTLTEVIATLDSAPGKANREKVDKVFSEAVARGLILRTDSLDSSWEVDLSRMSFPVARAACRFIFQKIVERAAENEDGEVKDLNLITGASRMREYVRLVLRDELKPSVHCVVPKMEQGTLQAKEKVVRNHIDGNKA